MECFYGNLDEPLIEKLTNGHFYIFLASIAFLSFFLYCVVKLMQEAKNNICHKIVESGDFAEIYGLISGCSSTSLNFHPYIFTDVNVFCLFFIF